MYKNKNGSSNNISGKTISKVRKSLNPPESQRALADKMQLYGIDLDKNAIQRIECGKRFVTDIELVVFAQVLNISFEELLENKHNEIIQ